MTGRLVQLRREHPAEQEREDREEECVDGRALRRAEQAEALAQLHTPQVLPRTPAVRVLSQRVVAWEEGVDVIAEDDCFAFLDKPAGVCVSLSLSV